MGIRVMERGQVLYQSNYNKYKSYILLEGAVNLYNDEPIDLVS